ncbi:MAG: HigA family addiction module antidote protein [Proteobacteria bacterium]|nr:HigA family addiction module antidote protein [Pseudomonadota bacterium]
MYLKPNGIGIGRFAKAIGYSRKHVSAVINGRSRFDAEFAARVGKALGTSTELWIGLQGATDAYKADRATRNWKPAERFAPAAAHD